MNRFAKRLWLGAAALALLLGGCSSGGDVQEQKQQTAYEKAVAYQQNNLYDDAQKEYAKAIREKDRSALAYTNRGDIYFKKGQFRKAIDSYSKAINLDPKNPWHYYARGRAQHASGNAQKAKEDFRSALKLEREREARGIKIRNAPNYVALINFVEDTHGGMVLEWRKQPRETTSTEGSETGGGTATEIKPEEEEESSSEESASSEESTEEETSSEEEEVVEGSEEESTEEASSEEEEEEVAESSEEESTESEETTESEEGEEEEVVAVGPGETEETETSEEEESEEESSEETAEETGEGEEEEEVVAVGPGETGETGEEETTETSEMEEIEGAVVDLSPLSKGVDVSAVDLTGTWQTNDGRLTLELIDDGARLAGERQAASGEYELYILTLSVKRSSGRAVGYAAWTHKVCNKLNGYSRWDLRFESEGVLTGRYEYIQVDTRNCEERRVWREVTLRKVK